MTGGIALTPKRHLIRRTPTLAARAELWIETRSCKPVTKRKYRETFAHIPESLKTACVGRIDRDDMTRLPHLLPRDHRKGPFPGRKVGCMVGRYHGGRQGEVMFRGRWSRPSENSRYSEGLHLHVAPPQDFARNAAVHHSTHAQPARGGGA